MMHSMKVWLDYNAGCVSNVKYGPMVEKGKHLLRYATTNLDWDDFLSQRYSMVKMSPAQTTHV